METIKCTNCQHLDNSEETLEEFGTYSHHFAGVCCFDEENKIPVLTNTIDTAEDCIHYKQVE